MTKTKLGKQQTDAVITMFVDDDGTTLFTAYTASSWNNDARDPQEIFFCFANLQNGEDGFKVESQKAEREAALAVLGYLYRAGYTRVVWCTANYAPDWKHKPEYVWHGRKAQGPCRCCRP